MKVLELFSGYGTASFALKRLVEQGIIDNYECVGYSDIDKYANKCFRQNHFNEIKHEGYSNLISPKELGDIKNLIPEELEDFDLLTGGFPCQAFSVAGKGLGELDPRGTLFYEIIRIAEVKQNRIKIDNSLIPYSIQTFINDDVIYLLDGNSIPSYISEQKEVYRGKFPKFIQEKGDSQTGNEIVKEDECFLQCVKEIWNRKYNLGNCKGISYYERCFDGGNINNNHGTNDMSSGLQYNKRGSSTRDNNGNEKENINSKQRTYSKRGDKNTPIEQNERILSDKREQVEAEPNNEKDYARTKEEGDKFSKDDFTIKEDLERTTGSNENMEREILESEERQEYSKNKQGNTSIKGTEQENNNRSNKTRNWILLEDNTGKKILISKRGNIKDKNGARWMLLENVKGLTNKNHRPTFEKILSELARIGYKVHWKILNTKDYGIPQNRERVWFVCFREKSDYDKFKFPEKEELKIFIKDILEEQVNEKYFLSELLQERFRKYLEEKNCVLNPYNKKQSDKIVGTIGTSVGGATSKTAQIVLTRNGYETDMSKPEIGEDNRLYGVNGVCPPLKRHEVKIYDRKGFDSRDKFRESELSPTLSTKMGTGGNNVPMVQAQISNCSPREAGFKDICPCLAARDYKDPKIVSNAITTAVGRVGHSKEELGYIENNMRCGQLRRLTPKECFRLMGFLNDEVNLEGISDTQKYKLAGNGQSVNVVEKIFKQMFK